MREEKERPINTNVPTLWKTECKAPSSRLRLNYISKANDATGWWRRGYSVVHNPKHYSVHRALISGKRPNIETFAGDSSAGSFRSKQFIFQCKQTKWER